MRSSMKGKSRRPSQARRGVPGSPSRPSPSRLISLRPNPDRRRGNQARPRQARQSPPKAPGSDKSISGRRYSRLFALFLLGFCRLGGSLGGFRVGRGRRSCVLTIAPSAGGLGFKHRFRSSCRSSSRFLGVCTAHRHIISTRNALRFVCTARDCNGDCDLDFGMKRQWHFVLADRLDWCIERNQRTRDLCSVILEQGSNITRGNRAKQLTRFASLTQHHVALAVELARKLAGFALQFEVARLKLDLHLLESLLVVDRRSQGLAARE